MVFDFHFGHHGFYGSHGHHEQDAGAHKAMLLSKLLKTAAPDQHHAPANHLFSDIQSFFHKVMHDVSHPSLGHSASSASHTSAAIVHGVMLDGGLRAETTTHSGQTDVVYTNANAHPIAFEVSFAKATGETAYTDHEIALGPGDAVTISFQPETGQTGGPWNLLTSGTHQISQYQLTMSAKEACAVGCAVRKAACNFSESADTCGLQYNECMDRCKSLDAAPAALTVARNTVANFGVGQDVHDLSLVTLELGHGLVMTPVSQEYGFNALGGYQHIAARYTNTTGHGIWFVPTGHEDISGRDFVGSALAEAPQILLGGKVHLAPHESKVYFYPLASEQQWTFSAKDIEESPD